MEIHGDQNQTGQANLDRIDWIDGGVALLAESGVNSVKIEPLSKRLGVTKGSFYWHFRNRPALLAAMVEHWEERQTTALIRLADDPDTSPADKLHMLFGNTMGDDATGLDSRDVELAIRDWARNDPAALMAVRSVDARRSVYVENFFAALGCAEADAKARAGLFLGLIFSEAMLARDEKPSERFERVASSLNLLIGARHETSGDASREEDREVPASRTPRPTGLPKSGIILGKAGSQSVN